MATLFLFSIIAFAVLFIFVIWALEDASFGEALELARIVLCIQAPPGSELRPSVSWNNLGWRLLLMIMLALTGCACAIVMCWIAASRASGDGGYAAVALPLALLCGWVVFSWAYVRSLNFGLVHRLKRDLVTFRGAAAELLVHWPTADGMLRGLGPFRVCESNEDIILLAETIDSYSWNERLRGFATRLSAQRGVRFELRGSLARLEYLPGAESVNSHIDTTTSIPLAFTLRRSVRIADDWFLVFYAVDASQAILARSEFVG